MVAAVALVAVAVVAVAVAAAVAMVVVVVVVGSAVSVSAESSNASTKTICTHFGMVLTSHKVGSFRPWPFDGKTLIFQDCLRPISELGFGRRLA